MRKGGWYWISIDEERGFDEIAYWCPARGWQWDGCWQGSDAIFFVKIDEHRIDRETKIYTAHAANALRVMREMTSGNCTMEAMQFAADLLEKAIAEAA